VEGILSFHHGWYHRKEGIPDDAVIIEIIAIEVMENEY